ncbi:hypothetical protein Patl1_11025 [Pistacia atlantica]|uniref:Uncharacterized protein n=1 Tax=Pistacia atlantica TaxID=434234 RepID=A0ACC1A5C4_9ROSI|nr:hypothetical protein Patl1_11025 [Pistacia atlantica]
MANINLPRRIIKETQRFVSEPGNPKLSEDKVKQCVDTKLYGD